MTNKEHDCRLSIIGCEDIVDGVRTRWDECTVCGKRWYASEEEQNKHLTNEELKKEFYKKFVSEPHTHDKYCPDICDLPDEKYISQYQSPDEVWGFIEQSLKSQQEQVLKKYAKWLMDTELKRALAKEYTDDELVDAFLKELESDSLNK